MSEFVENYREDCRRGSEAQLVRRDLPENVTELSNLAYGADPVWNRLDLFLPTRRTGRSPVLVNVHGGGWVWGDKEYSRNYCAGLAAYGFAVVSFSYRLAPEARFPAQLEDLTAVIRYLREHAERFALDLNRVCMIGDSAGAHLAALYACACTNEACAEAFRISETLNLRAIALNCGVYDLEGCGSELIQGLLEETLPAGLTRRQASPTTWLTAAFPDAYLLTARGDFLNGETPLLAGKLNGLGVPCIVKVYGTEENPLFHDFQCDLTLAEARGAAREECAFLLRHSAEKEDSHV